MRENIFPTKLAFTGYSGVSMRLYQEGKEVAYVGAISYEPQNIESPSEAQIFAGQIVIYSLDESFDTNKLSEVEMLPDVNNMMGSTELHGRVRIKGMDFFQGLRMSEACWFTAQAIVVEEYHQLPIKEEV